MAELLPCCGKHSTCAELNHHKVLTMLLLHDSAVTLVSVAAKPYHFILLCGDDQRFQIGSL